MPVTMRTRQTGPASWVHEVVDRTPDAHALEWPGLVSVGALHAVDVEMLAFAPELAGLCGLVPVGEYCIERHAEWFAESRADAWWLRRAFAARRAYWWVLRELLWRRLGAIVAPEPGEEFAWRRHFRPLTRPRRALERRKGR